jgi:lipid A 3-O-deacylase
MRTAIRSLPLLPLVCVLSALSCLAPSTARADLGVWTGVGIAEHHTSTVDTALVWDPHIRFWNVGDWNMALLGELHAAWFHNSEGEDPRDLGAFGATPVFRCGKTEGALRPYFEAGVGIRFLTGTELNDSYHISTSFQFADMVGAGVAFGEKGQYQVGYRFQHISNASIKRPNPGIDFHQIYFGYMF